MQKRYIKWTLNLDACTPDYTVYKETDIERIRVIACRADKFEERTIKEGNRKLAIECVKKKEREGGDKIQKSEREKFYRENDFSSEEVKLLKEREMNLANVNDKRARERSWGNGQIEK